MNVQKKSKLKQDDFLGSKINDKKILVSDSNLDDLYVKVVVEKSRINRDIANIAFKKGVMMYFILIILAMVGLVKSYISKSFFFTLVFMSLGSLVVGSIPYIYTMISEKKKMNAILLNLLLKDNRLIDYDEKYMSKFSKNSKNPDYYNKYSTKEDKNAFK